MRADSVRHLGSIPTVGAEFALPDATVCYDKRGEVSCQLTPRLLRSVVMRLPAFRPI